MFNKIIFVLSFLIALNSYAESSSAEWKVTQRSKGGHFETALICTSAPAVGAFQDCQLKISILGDEKPTLKQGDVGKLLKNAKVYLEGGMPAHHHGLPTSPVVDWSASEKAYVIKGLKFSMPGEWFLRFYINDADKVIKDKVSFSFRI